MPINRFYIDVTLNKGEEVSLEDQEFHHLSRVTRTEIGETVELVNGKGVLAAASVTTISRKKADLKVLTSAAFPEPSFSTVLALAIPRINRLDLIVEKGTELGMSKLLLFPGASSEKKEIFDHQLHRLKAIAISAMKQSGRLYLPQIELMPPLKKWKDIPKNSYFGDISPTAPPLYEICQKQGVDSHAYFFVGPESGFTKDETSILQKASVSGVSLNQNILRTETAAIAALTIIEHICQKHLPS